MTTIDTVRIVIEPTSIRGERGCHYRVLYADEVLIEDCWCPEYDAARALVAKGVTGKVEVLREGKVVSSMDVERGAELTITENAQAGPKVTRYVPFSPGWVATPGGVSGRPRVLEPADEDGRW